jgi:uncharacterized protein YjbI with pentapeptide repeats
MPVFTPEFCRSFLRILHLLKQDVEQWNIWRIEHPETHPNLGGADLRQAHLQRANLHGVSLWGADFGMADLRYADLSRSGLRGARFTATRLHGANLSHTNLWDASFGNLNVGFADLSGADLSYAQLGGVDLSHVNLSGACLKGADLGGVNFSEANLDATDFTEAIMAGTTLGDRDLQVVKGLDTVQHRFPSPLSIHTLYRSKGNIPKVFLRGVGMPKEWIAIMRSSIQYYSVFISYSSIDEIFVKRLYTDLQAEGVCCWFSPHDLPIGAKNRPDIDKAIYMQEKLLLILSSASVASDWVEHPTGCATSFTSAMIWLERVLQSLSVFIMQRYFRPSNQQKAGALGEPVKTSQHKNASRCASRGNMKSRRLWQKSARSNERCCFRSALIGLSSMRQRMAGRSWFATSETSAISPAGPSQNNTNGPSSGCYGISKRLMSRRLVWQRHNALSPILPNPTRHAVSEGIPVCPLYGPALCLKNKPACHPPHLLWRISLFSVCA